MLRTPYLVAAALSLTLGIGETLVSAGAAEAAPPTRAQIMASLTPFGDWVVAGRWGRVWAPRGMPANWRPYTYGHWTVASDVWTWHSDWRWGWAAFHYGRWTYDVTYGWVWVPGDVWAPAWVVWRDSGGYVGWAPAPPGYSTFGFGVVAGLPSAYWCFVDRRYIGRRGLRRRLIAPARVPRYVRRSRVRTGARPAAPPRGAFTGVRRARSAAGPAVAPVPARAVPALPAREAARWGRAVRPAPNLRRAGAVSSRPSSRLRRSRARSANRRISSQSSRAARISSRPARSRGGRSTSGGRGRPARRPD